MRRRWFLQLLASLSTGWSALALAAESDPVTPGAPSLKDTLEKGLKARRPQEFEFIARVVAKVDAHQLPRKTVESTFLWARKKRQPHAFQYFQRAIQLRASKLGVAL
jgi:hypothetical protein